MGCANLTSPDRWHDPFVEQPHIESRRRTRSKLSVSRITFGHLISAINKTLGATKGFSFFVIPRLD
jgi:hypothetical protein